MSEMAADAELVGRCGLCCAACGACLKGRCPGCHENKKATWCKVRACCGEHGYATCADCEEFADPRECRKFHNLFSRVIGLVLRSDRRACIERIREIGPAAYAEEMVAKGAHTLRPRP